MGHRCAGYYVNCTIQFGQDGSVSSVGNVTRGEFKPNADVAGIGVSSFRPRLGVRLGIETDKRLRPSWLWLFPPGLACL